MRDILVDVILVMSCGQFSHAEAAGAHAASFWQRATSFSCSVVYYDFGQPQDLLVVLDLSDGIF